VSGPRDGGDVHRDDLVQWSRPSKRIGRPREAHLGIVVRSTDDGSWVGVWQSSSLAMRQDSHPAEECRLTKRVRTSIPRMQIAWDARKYTQ
jgi:hypothetical protein